MRTTLDPTCDCGRSLFDLDDAPGGYVCVGCHQHFTESERVALEDEPVSSSVLRVEAERCARKAREATTTNEQRYWSRFAVMYEQEMERHLPA